MPKIVPLRVATELRVERRDPDPRGMPVIGADRQGRRHGARTSGSTAPSRRSAISRSSSRPRAVPGSVLLPITLAKIHGARRQVDVQSILAAQFADVPGAEEPRSGDPARGGQDHRLLRRRQPLRHAGPAGATAVTGDGDVDFEPVPGLPAPLPAGETLLWQGAPDWRDLRDPRLPRQASRHLFRRAAALAGSGRTWRRRVGAGRRLARCSGSHRWPWAPWPSWRRWPGADAGPRSTRSPAAGSSCASASPAGDHQPALRQDRLGRSPDARRRHRRHSAGADRRRPRRLPASVAACPAVAHAASPSRCCAAIPDAAEWRGILAGHWLRPQVCRRSRYRARR